MTSQEGGTTLIRYNEKDFFSLFKSTCILYVRIVKVDIFTNLPVIISIKLHVHLPCRPSRVIVLNDIELNV